LKRGSGEGFKIVEHEEDGDRNGDGAFVVGHPSFIARSAGMRECVGTLPGFI
jgi:hypothetical protein